MMNWQLQVTLDQSHTLFVPELNETYHSRNGAITESQYVYLQQGLYTAMQKQPLNPIRILEVGFGTGLNAWLTAMACETEKWQCAYISLEPNPIPFELISQLNYTSNQPQNSVSVFNALHSAIWDATTAITPYFELKKLSCTLDSFNLNEPVDLVYFDAFGPDKQPDLWTEPVFAKLHSMLNPGGIMVTYASKGAVKRILKKIGFEVERLPGPPYKRHMLRATKPFTNES